MTGGKGCHRAKCCARRSGKPMPASTIPIRVSARRTNRKARRCLRLAPSLRRSSPTSAAASEQPKVAHASLAIKGMDCAACASAVEDKLKALKGVRNVAVSVESQKAEVDYEAGATTVSELEKAIKDAGYEVRKI